MASARRDDDRVTRAPVPRLLVVLGLAFLATPLLGLLTRVPWSELGAQFAEPSVRQAVALSLGCSLGAALLAGVLGLPLAHWLSGPTSWGRRLARVLVVLPMVLPPVVAGLALLLAFGRQGVIGAPLEAWTGITLAFTPAAVILAEAYVALPFFVLAVESGLRSVDRRYLEAAATLGAGPARRFRTITLPLIGPALRAGLLLAWARALGEFGATITFAGNLEGSTRTLPLAVYTALETGPEAAIALSLVLILISITVLVVLRHRWFPSRGPEATS
jgi:molybdate transport system permease protein